MIATAVSIVFLWICFAVVTAIAGSSRGRAPALWALLGLLFGPFALVAALVLPRKLGHTHVACPACAEPVLRAATICRYCGSKLAGIVGPSAADRELTAAITKRAERWALAIVGGIALAAFIIAAS